MLAAVAVVVALVAGGCGGSGGGDTDVVGRWYESMDESGSEIDSTSFFIFNEDQTFARRYHNAGSLEVGNYACSDDTKEDYGDHPSRRVILDTATGEKYYIDAVCPMTTKELKKFKKSDPDKQIVWMFVFTYRINDKEQIKFYVKDKTYSPDGK